MECSPTARLFDGTGVFCCGPLAFIYCRCRHNCIINSLPGFTLSEQVFWTKNQQWYNSQRNLKAIKKAISNATTLTKVSVSIVWECQMCIFDMQIMVVSTVAPQVIIQSPWVIIIFVGSTVPNLMKSLQSSSLLLIYNLVE